MKKISVLIALAMMASGWGGLYLPAMADEPTSEVFAGQSEDQEPDELSPETDQEATVEPDEATEPVTAEEAPAERRRAVRRLGDVVSEGSEDWSMDIPTLDMPQVAAEDLPQVSLPNAEQDARLQSLITRRAFNPDSPEVQAELDELLAQVDAQARQAINAGNMTLAGQLVNVITEFEPNRAVVGVYNSELNRQSSLAQNLSQAAAAMDAGRLVTPPGQSALDFYQQALELDPANATAASGLVNLHQALLAQAVVEARELDFETASDLINRAEAIHDAPDAVAEARSTIETFREDYLDSLRDGVLSAIEAGEYDRADGLITQLVAMGYPRAQVERLRNSLEDARIYGGFEPGQEFFDRMPRINRDGPAMVVIPAGSFMMGSPDGESDRASNEGPRHRVTIARGFALSRTEITVGQFAEFINATGYRTDAEASGGSRVYEARSGRMDRQDGVTWRDDYMGDPAQPDLPVIHVSWNDAVAYVNWLSEHTGRNYRLPSEAEFEYALRAGSQDRFWWGDDSPPRPLENLTGDGDASPTNARWRVAFRRYTDGFWGPAPVGSLEANPFGLYDMGGNVMEWTEDCWHDSYVRAPADGSAWVNPGCDRRVIRGGSWSSTPAMSRSAFRLSSTPDSTDMRVGFRVARDL
ncbi:MAG: SUMF1/EgtB/PvdO family nonheme iron enzyme [Wenzhouxiangella sp.]